MSPRITHSKVSGKPNPTDASKVGGEDWDADHVIDGLTIGTDVQAHDTTLDALAAFDSNGIMVQYGTDQFTARTLTGTANEISVAHGDGFGGNPTISLPSALTFTGKTITGGTFNDILSMTAHKANSTANSIAATATLAQFYSGQSANPVTDKLPTVSISRYDSAAIDTAGSYNSALLVDVIGNQGNPGGGLFPQASGIVSRVVQNGFGDALGMGVEVVGNGGGGRFAYGYFFNVWAKVAEQAAFGVEGLIVNDTADLPFSSGNSVYLAAANLGAAGSWNTTAGVYFTSIFGKKFDVGVLFGAGSIQQASIFDDSNSVTILKAYGSHTDGIDLTHGTFSGSPFKSTGFSVSNVGAVTALSLTTPVVYGGTAANSALILKSTTNGSPSGDVAYLQGSAIVLRNQQNAASLVSIGASGQSQSNLQMAGSTSGSVTLTTAAAATGTLTLPNATDTLVGKATTDTLTNKSMSGATNTFTSIPISTAISGLGTGVATALGVNVGSAGAFVTFNGALGSPSSVGTLPAHTLGGAVSGGGNQINNVIIGASTPLAGSFTTLSASTSLTSPIIIGGSATTGTLIELRTTSGSGTTDALIVTRGTNGGTLALTVDNRGLHVGAGVNGASSAGDITLGRSGTTGVMYFGSNGGQYIYYDGSKYQVVGGTFALFSAAYLMRNMVSWTNNAAAATGTLTNAPAAGNPTKWIAIDDNGTNRYIPAW